jgi:hypothetical protein
MKRERSNRTEKRRPRSATRDDSRRVRGATDAADTCEADLDRELADTFPASDPISRQVPSTIVR